MAIEMFKTVENLATTVALMRLHSLLAVDNQWCNSQGDDEHVEKVQETIQAGTERALGKGSNAGKDRERASRASIILFLIQNDGPHNCPGPWE